MNVWRQALYNERAFLEEWRQQVDAHNAAVLGRLRAENRRLREAYRERVEDRRLDAVAVIAVACGEDAPAAYLPGAVAMTVHHG